MKASIGVSGVTGVFRILSEPVIDQYQSLKGYRFKGRGTVAVVLVYDAREILLVHSAKGDSWGFIQGGIEEDIDVNLLGATQREATEEVGVTRFLTGSSMLLGEFLNDTPASRGCSCKHIFILSVPVHKKDWVKLNEENDEYVWVESSKKFRSFIGERPPVRSVKYRATLDAVDILYAYHKLTWSSQS